MKKKILLTLCGFLVLGLVVNAHQASALKLVLKRVVFEKGKRAEVLTLINSSEESRTYRLSWKDVVMTPSNGLKDISEVEGVQIKPAKDIVKFSPRRVTLPPGTSQQIRLALRTPPGLADGEYRSHLWIRKEADIEKLNSEVFTKQRQQTKGKKIEIALLPGVTIPVVVRKGSLEANVNFNSVTIVSSGEVYKTSLVMGRTGQRSVYGDIDFTCNPDSDSYLLRSIRGVAIYTEIESKTMEFTMKKPKDLALCKTIDVKYVETSGYNGDPVGVLAETTVTVQ